MDTRSVQVRHPAAGDLVGKQLTVAGVGHGFEGTIAWQLVRDGQVVQSGALQSAGGMMALAGFAETVQLPASGGGPATLQVFGDNPGLPDEGPSPGFDLNEVPVILVPGMYGFMFYEVKAGDTLHAIAAELGSTVGSIALANPEIADPDKIKAGQTLRVPLLE